jgi:hypothetical protein
MSLFKADRAVLLNSLSWKIENVEPHIENSSIAPYPEMSRQNIGNGFIQ